MTRRSLASVVLFFSSFLVSAFSQESGIQTNAQGGVFRSDRRFWFAVPDGQRMRLSVNGNETYRGIGPASSTLTARVGEDRSYEIIAERRSAPPDDALLESRSFVVRIDAAAPSSVTVSGTPSADSSPSWSLTFEAEEGSRIFSVVDADSYLSSNTDTSSPQTFNARRVEGLVWCVDAAGNSSVPSSFSFKPFSLSVANPVPGSWANKQRLVIASEGASDVFWSDEGQDPFGPTGKRYGGAVLIDKTGDIVLNVAAKSPDGRIERREISYTVSGSGNPALSAIGEIETNPVLTTTTVSVSSGYRWDIGAEGNALVASGQVPALVGDRLVALRPVQGLRRFVPLFLHDGKSVYRFVFTLGAEKSEVDQPLPVVAGASAEVVPSAPLSYVAGRARILVWDRKIGGVRYRWKGSEFWNDALQPVPVASEGGDLEWLVDKGATLEGPFFKAFPSTAAEASFPSAIPFSSIAPALVSAHSVDLSAPADVAGVRFSLSSSAAGVAPRTFELARLLPMRIDICDGEQISWTASGEGTSLSVRIDRRPPAPPRVVAPEDGSWARDVPVVTFSTDEGKVEATARWKDEDGRTGSYALPISARLRSFKKGPVEYALEARVVDEAGNAGVLVSRHFTVDESTVYASDAKNVKSTEGAKDDEAIVADGSRAAPFSSLNEALALARAQGRSRVWIAGSVTMRGRSELFDGVSVEGGYGNDWKKGNGKSEIIFSTDAALFSKSGYARLSGLRIVESGSRGSSPLSILGSTLEMEGIVVVPALAEKIAVPFLYAQTNAVVRAKDCQLSGGSPAVESNNSKMYLTECLISGTPFRDGRAIALRATDSTIRMETSRLEAGKVESTPRTVIAVGIDARGGSISLVRTVIVTAADESSSGVVVRNIAAEATDVDVFAIGQGYASAVSAEGGSVSFVRGVLSSTARDSVALILNDAKNSRFDGVGFVVEGSAVVRAVQVRGLFPSISGCRFSAKGSSAGSEVLAGDSPASGTVRGNLFSGFSFLYDRSFDMEALVAFNRRFAGKGPANEIAVTGGM